MLLVTILAGCGGAGAKSQVVTGKAFTIDAPAGWAVSQKAREARASHGSDIVAVRTFPLSRRYSPALFPKVRREVEQVAKQLQQQLRATLTGRIVTVAGEQAWQYDLVHGDRLEQITFVLREKTEFELYCRRGKSESSAPCDQLVRSFRLR